MILMEISIIDLSKNDSLMEIPIVNLSVNNNTNNYV